MIAQFFKNIGYVDVVFFMNKIYMTLYLYVYSTESCGDDP